MRVWFKILGLLSILLVCTAAGFMKAFSLKGRYDNLVTVKNGILKLRERIRLHSGNKSCLLTQCFPASITLNGDDKKLFDEFIENFGKGDTREEIERSGAYASLFETKIKEAKKEADEQQRLYKTLGFLSGLFLCIFFI